MKTLGLVTASLTGMVQDVIAAVLSNAQVAWDLKMENAQVVSLVTMEICVINTVLQIVKGGRQRAFQNVIKNRGIVILVVNLDILDHGATRLVVVAVMEVPVIKSVVHVRQDVRHTGLVLNVTSDAASTV